MGLVVLDLPNDMTLRLVLDLETYRIVRSQGALRMGPQEVVFETAYSDFREVDGVLFAFGEENYASGMHTATSSR